MYKNIQMEINHKLHGMNVIKEQWGQEVSGS